MSMTPLEQEVLNIIKASNEPLTISQITRRSKITEHESRIGKVVRSLSDKCLISAIEMDLKSGIGYIYSPAKAAAPANLSRFNTLAHQALKNG